MTENRYNDKMEIVTAGRGVRVEGAHLQRIAESTLAPAPTNGEIDAAALRSLETVSEKSTPVARAWGVAIKSGVVVVVTLWATYALGRAGATGLQTGLFFALVTLGGVGYLYWLDYSHSPIGGERHKANLFAGIRHHEIDSNERVALAKLSAYTKTLETVYGNDRTDQQPKP